MKLGVKIAQARRRKSLTQHQLAALCECRVTVISSIENSHSYPREARMLLGIAKVMGITAGELLDRIDSERRSRINGGKPG
jgi:transcriptional regulator with XRE-family HTH domain